jgi:hypothetical protein
MPTELSLLMARAVIKKYNLYHFTKSMVIKLSTIILLVITFQLLFTTTGNGQSIATDKVTLALADDSLATAMRKIEQQSIFRFFYRSSDVKPVVHLNLPAGTRTIRQTLDDLLQNTPLSFRQIDGNILLERKDRQQNSQITGRVVERSTKKPVANVSVFLNNTLTGAKTADDGTFAFNNARPGKYELIVSIIGFETYKQTITINNNPVALGDIEISSKPIVLNEVSVNTRRQNKYERQKYLSWFTKEFIGTSAIAGQCKILNPEVLELSYDAAKNTLTASSSDFLVIENQALGYRVKYMLTNFRLDNDPSAKIRLGYEGTVFFEELTGTAKQQKRRQKRRQSVYEGSAMHFLRSAAADAIEREGFRVFRLENYANPGRPADSLIQAKIEFYEKLKSKSAADSLAYWNRIFVLPGTLAKLIPVPLHQADIIKQTGQQGLLAFGPGKENTSLYITYNKNHHYYINTEPAYINGPANKETTLVKFNSPYAAFYTNGWLIPDSLIFNGLWANTRVAELLPVDYFPGQRLAATQGNTQTGGTSKALIEAPDSLRAGLLKLKSASDTISQSYTPEKLYLQFDKPYYAIGDTVWFKAYLLNATYLTATDKSGILYIDITNDSSKTVKQYSIPLQAGLGWGNIGLDEREFTPGTYTLRAYTNWMRNFDDNGFFNKRFYITGGEGNWLVNKQISTPAINGSDVADVKLQFSDIDKKPAANNTLTLEVMNGSKRLYKQAVQTNETGGMNVNFKLPGKAAGLAIIAQSENKDKKAVIPLVLNTPERADIQFLPEGGHLVAGLPAHIGFKAIGEDGRGVNVTGVITGREQMPVAAFKSLHNGMGSFNLAAKEGENYIAKVTFANGTVKEYPLPSVKTMGTVLQVKNLAESDSVEVFVAATNDIIQSGSHYFLIGRARGIVCYAAVIDFHGNNYVKRKVAKNLFPSGITHFTLMNTAYRPLNERLVFIDHHDNLDIRLNTDKPFYASADSVALHIQVFDNSGSPVRGNFSLAVTDDARIKTDSLNNENIVTRVLLTSGLKGYIEGPGYYFSKTGEAWRDLDNLLLTQGWTGYDWNQVFNPPVTAYQPEREFTVKGKVINVFNKPVKGTHVLLFSKSPAILMDTITDKEGRFIFDHFPPVDTPLFVLKAVNKNGKSSNVGIVMDEVKPPEVKHTNAPLTDPWYVNSDSTLLNYTKNNKLIKQQLNFPADGHLLKEVKVSAKKVIKASQHIYGIANVIMDEKDLEKAGKKNFLQLLEENIKGFHESYKTIFNHGGTANTGFEYYFINTQFAILSVDGIFLNQVLQPFDFIVYKSYLESHTAEDIKGIEVTTTSNPDYAFIEITTRSGHGPIIDNTPGMYLYKPLALSWPRQFYKPKYTVKDTSNHTPDLRSVIDWEPDIVTGMDGKAAVTLYPLNKPATYTVIIEGSDMNGSVGYHIQKIKIAPENKYP